MTHDDQGAQVVRSARRAATLVRGLPDLPRDHPGRPRDAEPLEPFAARRRAGRRGLSHAEVRARRPGDRRRRADRHARAARALGRGARRKRCCAGHRRSATRASGSRAGSWTSRSPRRWAARSWTARPAARSGRTAARTSGRACGRTAGSPRTAPRAAARSQNGRRCQTRPMSSDHCHVAKHAEEHLRRFLAARAGGDAAGMRRWWEELVIDFYDRMDGFIYAAHKGRLDEQEHEQALELALIRFSTRLPHTFAGTSMGELVNATKTLARGICMDVQRGDPRAARRAARRPAGRVHAPGSPRGRPPLRGRRGGRRGARLRGVGAAADPRDPAGACSSSRSTAPRSARSCRSSRSPRDNAYQRRSRAIKDLAKLKELYDT